MLRFVHHFRVPPRSQGLVLNSPESLTFRSQSRVPSPELPMFHRCFFAPIESFVRPQGNV